VGYLIIKHLPFHCGDHYAQSLFNKCALHIGAGDDDNLYVSPGQLVLRWAMNNLGSMPA
jgi:hypothetical protein